MLVVPVSSEHEPREEVYTQSPACLSPAPGPSTTMAAETPGSPEDYSLFLSENGHLSFENPNYQVRPAAQISSFSLLVKLIYVSRRCEK